MYQLTLPQKPSFLLFVAFYLFGDALMWAFIEGVSQASETHDRLVAENAALRKQVSQRDASGKFTKKSPS